MNSRHIFFVCSFVILVLMSTVVQATQWYVSPSGSNTNTGLSTSSPWKNIQFANDTASVANGDTLNLMSGSFAELVNITKSITLRAYNGNSVTLTAPGSASNAALVTISAPNVSVIGLSLDVNAPKATVGVFALNRANLSLVSNTILRSSSGGSFSVTSTNINETFASAAVVFVGDNASPWESISLQSNTLGSSSNSFERGVWMRATSGTIGGANSGLGNTISGSAYDMLCQFAGSANLSISNNTFNGAGLVIDEPNVFSTVSGYSVSVSTNTFSPSSNSFAQSLLIRHNYQNSTTVNVNSNYFSGHKVAVVSAGSAGVNIASNGFVPGDNNATHIRVNSAFSNSTSNFVQNSVSITANSFNAGSSNGVRAIELLDGNAGQSGQPSPSYSSVTIGTNSGNNSFFAGLAGFIRLASGFSQNVDASQNLFGALSASPASTASLSLSQLFDVENKIDHRIDYSALGLVTYASAKKFVTQNSYLSGFTTTPSIQRAIDAASSGDSVFVQQGTYAEAIALSAGISLCGDQLSSSMPTTILDVNNNTAISSSGSANKSVSRFELRINSGAQGRFGVISNNASNSGGVLLDFCSFRRNSALVGGMSLPGSVGIDVPASIDDGNDYSGSIGKFSVSNILGCPVTYTLSALTESPCETDSLILFLSGNQSTVSYSLSVNGVNLACAQSVTNDGRRRFAVPSMGAGEYQIQVRGTLGSCVVTMSGSPTLTAFTPQTPALSLNSLNQVLCSGNAGQITVINSEPLASYAVLDGSTVVVTPKPGNNGSIVFNLPASLFPPSGTKNFSVRASSIGNANCVAATASGNPDGAAFNVYPLPAAPVITTNNPNACSPGGSASIIVVNAEAGYTYQVVDGNTAVYSVTATTSGVFNINNIPVTPAVPGLGLGARTVRVYAINPSNNNCRVLSTNALTITVSQKPTKPQMATGTTTQSYCESGSGITAQLWVANGDAGLVYTVIDSTTRQVRATASGQSGMFAINVPGLNASGSVYKLFVIATNTTSGCESDGSVMNYITVSPIPHPVLSLTGSSQTGSIVVSACLGYSVGYALTSTTDMGNATNQWYVNNTVISGATSSSYTVPTGLNLGTYVYTLRQTSPLGCVGISNTFTFTVAQNLSVTASVQGGGSSASFFTGSSSTATLTTSVSPSGMNPSYQWLKDGNAISGATAATYVVPNTTSPGTYQFKVVCTTSSGCSTTSNAITVTVWAQPTLHIFVQANNRSDSSYAAGVNPPVLASTLSGSQGFTPSWQWYGPNNNNLAISGASSSTYTPASNLTPGVYQYILRATLGGVTVGSDTVTITVLTPATLDIYVAANNRNDSTYFVALPTPLLSSTIGQQNNIVFSYQWYGPNGSTAIAGASSASYAPPSNLSVGTYRYYAKISGGGQLVGSDTVVLTVLALPTLNAYVSPNVNQNDTTYFRSVNPPTLASALSNSNGYPVSYQWYGPNNTNPIGGATSQTFGVPSALSPGTYKYFVRATLGGVIISSDTITITILPDPVISGYVSPNTTQKDTSYFSGITPATLASVLTNNASKTPLYQWYSVESSAAISGATNSSYTVAANLSVGLHRYYVKASFPGLTIGSDTLSVTILQPASVDIYFVSNNRNDSTQYQGLSAPIIGSTITNSGSVVFSYQWYGPNSSTPISGATASTCGPVSNLTPGSYNYFLRISGGGVVVGSDTVVLTIAAPPTVNAYVVPDIAKNDTTYFQSVNPPTLSSQLNGNLGYPVSYQWYGPNNTNPISGATSQTFGVPAGLSPGTYKYFVRATLGGLVVASDTITVTILADPTMIAYIDPIQTQKTASFFQNAQAPTLATQLFDNNGVVPAYQWYDAGSGAAISGQTNSVYVLSNTLAVGTYTYIARATFPGLTIQSDTLTVHVLSAASVDIYFAANNRNDSTHFVGLNSPSIASTISNDGGVVFSYQWYGPNSSSAISGATNSTYTPASGMSVGSYDYYLVISGGGVSVQSDTVRLTIVPAPSLSAYVSPNPGQTDSTYFQSVNPPTLASQLSGNIGYPVSYQWYGPNGTNPIAGETNSSYGVPTNLSPGTYTYTVQATLGGLTVGSQTVTITILADPSIVDYIVPNTTQKDSTYYAGLNAPVLGTLLQNASSLSPSYQWYAAESGVAISGATNSTLSLFNTLSVGTHKYYTRAIFPGLTISSDTVQLTVLSAAAVDIFVVQNGRNDSTYYQGLSAPELGSTISNSGGVTFTYQWYGPNSTAAISGATSSTYTPSSSASPGTYKYFLRISGGGIVVGSDTVTLTVAAPPTVNAYISPNVNKNDSTYFRSMQPPTLSSVVGGNIGYPVSYQWYGPNSTNPIGGASNSSYNVPSNLSPGTYKYFVRVTLGGVVVGSDTVTVVVLPDPSIVAYISPVVTKKDTSYFAVSGPVTLSRVLSNNNSKTPSYQWYSVETSAAVTGATNISYTVPTNLSTGTHRYFVKATFPGLVITSDTVSVTILAPFSADIFVVANGRNDSTYYQGVNAPQLGSLLSGAGSLILSYQWYGPNSASAIGGATNSTYTPSSNLTPGVYKYFLRVTALGLTIGSDTVTITVAARPVADAFVEPNAAQNDSTFFRALTPPSLSVQISGNLGYPISYQWYGPNNTNPISGATTGTYDVPSNMTPGTYKYFVRATLGGIVVSSDTLTIVVLPNPTIAAYVAPNVAKKDSTYFQSVSPVTLGSVLTNNASKTPSYQWYTVASGLISGATQSSYTLPNAPAVGVYKYIVKATFPGLTISSDTVTITILPSAYVDIYVVANNRDDSTYYRGLNAPLLGSTIGNSGGVTFSYQWYGPNSSVAIVGATNATYTPPSSLGVGVQKYFLRISGGGVTIASDTVRLTIAPLPTANAYVSPNVSLNDSTYFRSVNPPVLSTLVGGNLGYPVAYQWYGPNSSTPISGATNASYAVPNLAPGTYKYFSRCTLGGVVVGSDTITITVLPDPTLVAYVAPTVTKKDSTYYLGMNAPTLASVLANNASRTPSYQWYNALTGTAISGATNASYAVPSNLGLGTYKYIVRASFPGLTISSDTVTITIRSNASVDIYVVANNRNDSTYFQGVSAPQLGSTISNSGGISFSYQWYGPNSGVAISGATNASYTPSSSLSPGSYAYFLRISGGGVVVGSDTVTIVVATPPTVNAYVSPKVNQNDSSYFKSMTPPTLSSTVGGNIGYPVTYQWYGPNNTNPISGATSSSFGVPSNLSPGVYKYFVRVSLGGLVVGSDTVTITILPDPSVIAYVSPVVTQKDTTYYQGQTPPVLASQLTNSSAVNPQYQWFSVESGVISGATNSTYGIPAQAPAGTHHFYVRVTFPGLSILSDSLTVTILSAPHIEAWISGTNHSYSISVCAGQSNVGLTSQVTGGSTPITYQWFLGTSAISGATNSDYTTPSSLSPGSYSYTVRATSGGLNFTSNTVMVVVNALPNPQIQLQSGSTSFCALSQTTATLRSAFTYASYQWSVNGNAISGATARNYTIPSTLNPGNYTYSLSVVDAYGCAASCSGSSNMTIVVRELPNPTIQVQSGSTSYCANSSIATTLSTQTGYTSYQWRRNGQSVSGATNALYSLPSSLSAGTHTYTVTVVDSNGCTGSSTSGVTVTISSIPSVTLSSYSQTQCVGYTGCLPVFVSASGCSAPPSYQWKVNGVVQSGATASLFYMPTGYSVGSYSVVGVVSCGSCTVSSNPMTFTVQALPSVTLSSSSQNLCAGYTVSTAVSAVVSSCTANPTYQWLLNGNAIQGATASSYSIPSGWSVGTYVLSVQVNCGACAVVSSAHTVSVSQAPNVSVSLNSGSQNLCVGYANGPQFSSTVSGCSSTASYQWYLNGSAISAATSSTYSVPAGLNAGSYSYQLEVVCGACTKASNALTIVVAEQPTVSLSTNSQSVCTGYTSSAAIAATVYGCSSTASFQWSVDGVAQAGATSAVFSAPTGLGVGTHNIQLAVSCGNCTTNSGVSSFIVGTQPAVTLSTTSTALCTGYTSGPVISATVAGCSSTANYQWYLNSSAISGATSSSYTVPTGLAAGSYGYSVSVQCGSCSASSSTTSITISAAPSVSLSPSTQTVCVGYSNCTQLSASVSGCSGNASYQWKKNGTTISGATSSTYSVPSGLEVGSYTFSVIVSCGNCSVTSASSSFVVNNAPSVTVSPSSQTVCVNYTSTETLGASVSGCSGNPSYQWKRNGTAISGATNATYTIPTGYNCGSNSFTVVVNCGGCSATSNASSMVVTNAPTIVVSPSSQTLCGGYSSSTTISASVTGCSGNPRYQWKKNGTSINGATNVTYTIPTGLSNGTYNYTLTVNCGNCSACSATSAASTVIVNGQVSVSVSSSASDLCAGYSSSPTLSASLSGCSGSASYQWKLNGSAISGATASTYNVPTGLSVGSYAYTVAVVCGNCSSTSATKTISVSASPSISITPGSQTVCTGYNSCSTLTSSLSGCTTATYQWYHNGSAISGATGANYTVPTSLAVGVHSYYVIATSGGCSATSNTATITVNGQASVSLSPSSQSLCLGYSSATQLTVTTSNCSGSASYQWKRNGSVVSGATASSYTLPTGLAAGSYSYTVVVSCGGCTTTSNAAVVVVSSPPSVSVGPATQTLCYGYSSAQSLSATVSGCSGTPSYQWRMNGNAISGATSSSYSIPQGLAVGSYSFVVDVSFGGCIVSSSTMTVVVSQAQGFTLSVVSGSTDLCTGYTAACTNFSAGSIFCSATATYQWYVNGSAISGATTTQFAVPAGLAAGTYNYSMTYTCGACTVASSNVLTLNVASVPAPSIVSSVNSYCSGSTTTALLSTAGGSFSSYQWNLNGSAISGATAASYQMPVGLSAGNYSYTVTVSNGSCSSTSAAKVISVTQGLSASVSCSGPSICAGSSASVVFSLTGGSSSSWTLVYSNGTQQFTVSNISGSSFTLAVSPSYTTTYSIVSVSAGGCTTTGGGSTTVTVGQSPSSQTIGSVDGSPGSACFGTSQVYTIPSAVSGNTYVWSVISSVSGISSTQNSNTQFTVNYPEQCSSGSYTVTIKLVETSSTGCARTNTITTNVIAPPNVLSPLVGNSTLCLGQSTTISIPSPQTGVSYSLYKGSTQIGSTLASTGAVSWTLSPTSVGSVTYTVKAVNASGCSATMNTVSINVITAPSVSISSEETSVCPGTQGSVSFSFTGQGPWTLTYKIGSGSNITVNTSANPYTITQTLNASTVFTVISVQNSTCSGTISGSTSLTLSVAEIPTQSFCMGFAGDDATVNGNSKVTSWDNYAGTGSNFPNGSVNTSSDGARPQKYPNYSALNGHAGIYFDGNDQPVSVSVNTGSGISGGSQKSWFMVYRPASSAMSYSRQVIYKQGDENHGFCVYVINRVIYYGAWNNQNCSGSCTNKWSVFQNTGFCVTPGNNYLLQMVYNGNASSSNRLRFSINGSVYTPSSTAGTSMSYSGDAVSIGGKVGNTRFHDMASVNDCTQYPISSTKIAEVLLYNTSDATVRNQVWCVLKSKYGFSGLGNNPIGAMAKGGVEDEFVAGEAVSVPTYELSESQPNPARDYAMFNLSVESQQRVRICVLSEIGQEMAVVYHGVLSRGSFNPINVETARLASGAYILRVEGEDFVSYRSFIVVH